MGTISFGLCNEFDLAFFRRFCAQSNRNSTATSKVNLNRQGRFVWFSGDNKLDAYDSLLIWDDATLGYDTVGLPSLLTDLLLSSDEIQVPAIEDLGCGLEVGKDVNHREEDLYSLARTATIQPPHGSVPVVGALDENLYELESRGSGAARQSSQSWRSPSPLGLQADGLQREVTPPSVVMMHTPPQARPTKSGRLSVSMLEETVRLDEISATSEGKSGEESISVEAGIESLPLDSKVPAVQEKEKNTNAKKKRKKKSARSRVGFAPLPEDVGPSGDRLPSMM